MKKENKQKINALDYQMEYIKMMLQYDQQVGLELLKLNKNIENAQQNEKN
jgi:hypothetical protein